MKVIYEHVDILNKHGYEAYVLHETEGFRCSWFENSTKIAYVEDVKLGEKDFLVFPEVHTKHYLDSPKKPDAEESPFRKFKQSVRKLILGYYIWDMEAQQKVFRKLYDSPAAKIIFNQGCYLTFSGYPLNNGNLRSLYCDKSLSAIIVVSEDSEKYVNFAFPHVPAYRVRNAINTSLFNFQDEKKKQICFIARKNYTDIVQVVNILTQRGSIDDFELIPIENMPQQDVAKVMRDSLIFLSFGSQEGFSLPPAEAMACGCIVIGYDGRGGKEYFDPQFCFPVESGDIISFVQTIEKVLAQYRADSLSLTKFGQMASSYIYANYNNATQSDDVERVWGQIISLGTTNKSSI
ncbi:MAG: glycosyltransferase [Desulfuromonadales bacterium]|nr:glycosyltransferase [Desulfuromonadales bacterium]